MCLLQPHRCDSVNATSQRGQRKSQVSHWVAVAEQKIAINLFSVTGFLKNQNLDKLLCLFLTLKFSSAPDLMTTGKANMLDLESGWHLDACTRCPGHCIPCQ